MSFADSLPDDANKLRAKADEIQPCLCRWDWRADESDRDWKEFYRYPRSYPVITFAAACPIAEHSDKAGQQRHFNHWASDP